MDPFEMVVGIVAITAVASVVRARHRSRNTVSDLPPNQMAESAIAALRREVAALENRVAALEEETARRH